MSYLILLFLFFFQSKNISPFLCSIDCYELASYNCLYCQPYFPHFMCNRCQVNSLILVIFCLFVLIVPSFKKQLKSHLFRSTYTISVGGLCLMLVSVCTFFVSFVFQVTLSTNRKHSIKLIYIIIFSGKLQSRIEVFNREQRFPPFFFSRIDQI